MCEAGHAVLLAPNHSDHSDPHVVMEVLSGQGLTAYFMGAREIFETGAAAAWGLQAMGVFSVDRDGPDLSSLKTAMSLLEKGGDPLVIYPEGEIYHHHERLDPLHEGVASILLKVAGRLPEGKSAYLFPVAIRFSHDPAVAGTLRERLSRLEDRIGWKPKPSLPLDDRIMRLAAGVLALKETEYLGEASGGSIRERLAGLCERLLGDVEVRYPRDARAVTPPERVRALRFRIRRRLLDPENTPEPAEREVLLDDMDRIFTALQAHSYLGDYLMADPTLDRRAQMVLKLEEDILGFPTYPVARTVRVIAGEALDVSAMLAKGELAAKGGAGALTALLEERLGVLLEGTDANVRGT